MEKIKSYGELLCNFPKKILQIMQIGVILILFGFLQARGTDVTFAVNNSKTLTGNEEQTDAAMDQAAVQQVMVSGKVTDKAGNPLTGVSISVKDMTSGTISDIKGNFSLMLPPNSKILTFSFIGMKTQEVTIGNRINFSIVMEEELIGLNEVVVIGYGVMKRSDLTGAVASVKAEELNTIPVSNAMEALSGKVAGVDIGVITSVGESPSVRIRGNRSINASNSPLYVVDGIPRNSISDIPVDEIQSIEVLKDAVSASIYGSRGANGVILITTKSGRLTGGTQVEFSVYNGINYIKLPEFMDGDTYIRFRRDAARYQAYGSDEWATGAPLTDAQVFDNQELPAVTNKKYTDWKQLLYNSTTHSQDYNVSVTTSGEQNLIRFSAGYRNDEGYYPNNRAERLSLGLKADQQLFDFLKLSVNARYTNSKVGGADPGTMMASGTNTYNVLDYLNPLIPAYDENGELISNVIGAYANPLLDYVNPYINETNQHRLFTVFSVNAQIYKGLTYTSNFGYDINNNYGDVFYGKYTSKRYMVAESEGAFARKNNSFETNMTWDNILNYTETFNLKHNINATFVSSLQSDVSKYFSAQGMGLPDDVLENWNLGQLQTNILNSSSFTKRNLASFIGRVQYGYDNRYLLNISLRTDGASVLADGNKWAYFPAASLGWVISNEEFFKSQVVNNLKLRLSYGVVGNASINPYETFAGVESTRTNFGNVFTTGYSLSGLVNKGLGWEISKTTNLGVDWDLLNSRINGYVDAYYTYTSDLLFERSLPNLTGSTSIWQNIGETSNRGLEIMINSTNIKANRFTWRTSLNFTTNKTRIEKLITDDDMIDKNLFIGEPWRIYFGNVLEGIWQVDEAAEAAQFSTYPGYTKVKDISGPDGTPDGSISDVYDRIILGQRDPKWMMFVRNEFEYGNLTMAFALNGKFGHMIQMSGRGWENSNPLSMLDDYWTPDNPSGKYPIIVNTNMPSNWRYRDGDHINVQEISLRYDLKKIIGINDIGLSMQARNPFYLWKAAKDTDDPAAPDSDWTAWKSYVIRLDIKF